MINDAIIESVSNELASLPIEIQEEVVLRASRRLQEETDDVEVIPEKEKQEVEAILLDRMKGPFVEVDDFDAWANDIIKRGRVRLADRAEQHA